jgi:hypothetical protein
LRPRPAYTTQEPGPALPVRASSERGPGRFNYARESRCTCIQRFTFQRAPAGLLPEGEFENQSYRFRSGLTRSLKTKQQAYVDDTQERVHGAPKSSCGIDLTSSFRRRPRQSLTAVCPTGVGPCRSREDSLGVGPYDHVVLWGFSSALAGCGCSVKGGDPAAGSPTATLLRLHPSRRSHLRHRCSSVTSGANNSHGVTGGVYKARERIHRSVLISDY